MLLFLKFSPLGHLSEHARSREDLFLLAPTVWIEMVLRHVRPILSDLQVLNQFLANSGIPKLAPALDALAEILFFELQAGFLLEQLVHSWLEPLESLISHLV